MPKARILVLLADDTALTATVSILGALVSAGLGGWLLTVFKERWSQKRQDRADAISEFEKLTTTLQSQIDYGRVQIKELTQQVIDISKAHATALGESLELRRELADARAAMFKMQQGCEKGCPLLIDPVTKQPTM